MMGLKTKGTVTSLPIIAVFIILLLAGVSANAQTLIVNDRQDGWLNLRTGPSSNYRIIRRMYNGERVTAIAHKGKWAKVRTRDSITGWAYRPYMISARRTQPARKRSGGNCATKTVSGWIFPAMLCNNKKGAAKYRCIEHIQKAGCNMR